MNNTNRSNWSKWVVPMFDFTTIFTCYFLAYRIRFYNQIPEGELTSFLHYVPWLGILGIMTYHFCDMYTFTGRISYSKYFYNLIIAHFIIIVELIVLNYWLQDFILPRSIVALALALQLILMIGSRTLLFYIQSRGMGKKKTMIIVENSLSDRVIIEKVLAKGEKWFDVRGVIQADTEASQIRDSSFADIDLIILSPNIEAKLKIDIIRFAGREKKEVLLIPEFYELFLMGAGSQQIDDMLVYSIKPPHLSHIERIVKRTLDLIVSLFLLILASPIMLLMMILIPMSSHGKAFFQQERVGRDEKPFMVLKFRSMEDNAEKMTGPVLALAQDNRITKLGKFIRATRIDELPQLINVIKGEMSLVGPRPEREFFIHSFKTELPHYSYRLMVKPGITGLAQVLGNYSTLPSDKLRYDLMYIKNYSLLLDLKILFQTILVVLQREQSKGVASDEAKNGIKITRLLNTNAKVFLTKE